MRIHAYFCMVRVRWEGRSGRRCLARRRRGKGAIRAGWDYCWTLPVFCWFVGNLLDSIETSGQLNGSIATTKQINGSIEITDDLGAFADGISGEGRIRPKS